MSRPPRLLPLLRLVRAGTLFSPGADVLAGLTVAAAAGAPLGPWSSVGTRAVLASILLYAAGMILNDVADLGEDRRQRPERPIPRGEISRTQALVLGLVVLAGGVAMSPCMSHHALIAALVVAYDFACKRSALLGAATMGCLRGLNLATAGAIAPTGLPPALLVAALCYGGYIFAIAILGHFEDLPKVRPRAVITVQAAPLLLALVGLWSVQHGWWPAPALAAVPIVWLARRNRRTPQWDQAAIRRSMTALLLGTMLYTALLCVAVGAWASAGVIALCIPAARAVTAAVRLRTMS